MSGNEQQKFPVPREPIVIEQGKEPGLFYFHETGDYLKGILFAIQIRQTIHYEFATYRMKLWEGRQDGVDLLVKPDQVVEFPANLKMRRVIEDHELIGSVVRIIYKGKRGRYKKYEVWKDTGTFYESEDRKYGRTKRKRKKRSKPAATTGAGKKHVDEIAGNDGPAGGEKSRTRKADRRRSSQKRAS